MDQSGEGFFSDVLSGVGSAVRGAVSNALSPVVDAAARIVSVPGDIYASKAGTYIRNRIPASDAGARPAYPGEKHAIQILSNGKFGTANFMGPGTHIEERIKRGDPPRTPSDKVAMAHDIRYALHEDVRDADNHMVRKLTEMQNSGVGNSANISIGKNLIRAKMAAENIGLMNRNQFIADKPTSGPEAAMLRAKLTELEQEGFGRQVPYKACGRKRKQDTPPKPGMRLKRRLAK
jgi:hypothetical protein